MENWVFTLKNNKKAQISRSQWIKVTFVVIEPKDIVHRCIKEKKKVSQKSCACYRMFIVVGFIYFKRKKNYRLYSFAKNFECIRTYLYTYRGVCAFMINWFIIAMLYPLQLRMELAICHIHNWSVVYIFSLPWHSPHKPYAISS